MLSLSGLRRRAATTGIVLLAAAGMVACAEDIGPQRYPAYAEGGVAHVDEGTIVNFRQVEFSGRDNGLGTGAGAVAGGVIGSQFGGRGGDRAAFGILGAIGGAVAGNAIAKNADRHYGFAYLVRRRRDGSEVEVPQADPQPIPVGTRVYISYGDRVRVTPVNAYGPPPPPPPPPPGY